MECFENIRLLSSLFGSGYLVDLTHTSLNEILYKQRRKATRATVFVGLTEEVEDKDGLMKFIDLKFHLYSV